MPVYKIDKSKLTPLSSAKFDLEKDIQKLTELNLETLFNLKFISGSLNNEFSLQVQEQDFYIDTLAFDETQKSFVLIEYKKDKNFSVIDQGFAYLAAALNHKADLVLELNERLKKNFTKKDIDWEQTRVIFISPEFTNYQKNAINFKDLPLFLYEVQLYSDNLIDYHAIKPYRTSQSITKFTKDKTIQSVSREVKVYTEDDLVKPNWTTTRELLKEFEEKLSATGIETRINYFKYWVSYFSKHGRVYAAIVPQQQGLKIFFRFPFNYLKSSLKIDDCSKKGHLAPGNSYVYVTESSQISEAVRLSQESFKFFSQGYLQMKIFTKLEAKQEISKLVKQFAKSRII